MKLYKSYNFVDKDPIIDEVRTLIQEMGVTYAHIEEKSGVKSQTLRYWFEGKTKRPMASTIRAVLRAIGADLTVTRGPTMAAAPRPVHRVWDRKIQKPYVKRGVRA